MASRLEFYLLDVNTETFPGQTEVRLWGVDREGKPVLVRHPGVSAYFYVLPKPGVACEALAKAINKRQLPGVAEVTVVDKRCFGRPLRVVKIVSNQPDLLSKTAHDIGKLKEAEQTLEDDIRVAPRYLIDNGLVPCGWHAAQVQPSRAEGVDIDACEVQEPPLHLESAELPKLRILAFALVAVGLKGAAKPERDPLAVISAAMTSGEMRSFVRSGKDDRELLSDFQSLVREYDPDIVVGFTNNRVDWPYLITRAEKTRFRLTVDRSGSGPHPSMYGHMSLAGRANLDMYDIASDITEVKVKTLENTAEFFGIQDLAKSRRIEDFEYAEYWEDAARRKEFVAWNEARAKATLKLAELNLPFTTQLASLTGLSLDQVMTAAVGFRVDWYLIREAHKIGELVPKRMDQPYFPYRGAIVLEPKTGLHDNVAVLDFASMYPNIMILHNLSPDTLLRPREAVPAREVFEVKETKAKFRKTPEGFFPTVLRGLIEKRKQIRKQLDKLDPKTTEYTVLRERENAVKVITNACYGYAGWTGARWYVREVAESAAALGRETINEVIAISRKLGLTVIYGDTDSVFVANQPEKVEKLIEAVEEKFGLEIRVEKTYTRMVFTEAKKRYAGLLPDGRIDIVGLEVVRGDWADVAKNAQESVIQCVLEDKGTDRAVDYVRKTIAGLRSGQVPLRELVIWKTLTKSVEDYKVRAPHVEAARKLLKAGWELTTDDKVGYVIVKGPGKLYQKAQPLALANPNDVDVKYYESNQVLRVSSRILGMFGVTENELLPDA